MTTNRELFAVTSRIASEIIEALEESTGRKIWRLNERDRFKLYKLWLWSQRYHVPLDYILPVLVNYFTKGVEKRTGRRSKGLGVAISTLTGHVAEEVLQKAIAHDYPEGDHLSIWREQEADRILQSLDEDDMVPVRIKSTLEYKSLAASTKALIRSIEASRKRYDSIARSLSKIPFRNNPFI